MNPLYLQVAPEVVCYDNDNTALIPDIWAREAVALLSQTVVATKLVNREFENDIREFGETVKTRRPQARKARRRTDSDPYTAADTKLDNINVTLDQFFYDSFIIKDGEMSKSMQDLIQIHLVPAMMGIGNAMDRAIMGRVHQFFGTTAQRAGRLGNLSASNARDTILEAREILNRNNAPMSQRNLILTPNSETAFLKTDLFVAANQRGDGGSALENAVLGRIEGFDTYLGQNANYVAAGSGDVATGTVTNAANAGASGSQACTVTGYAANVGEYAVVAGNDQPTYLTAKTATTDTTAVTMNEANKYATSAGAAITIYKACAVNGAYDAGYAKEVLVDGWTNAPQEGQLVAFGTGAGRAVYTVIESSLSSAGVQALLLDRPLENALADNDLAFPGPAGSLNLAFRPDSIAMVSRPLALPPSDLVRASVASWDGFGIRVVMQYDSSLGGTRVNLDVLAGIAQLDALQCVPLLG
jgi:hypothetical protein